MTTSRGSKRFDAARVGAVALLAGCAVGRAPAAPPSSPPTGDADKHPSRRPDGVVLEPPPALPSPAEGSTAGGVIALREALGADAVREVVQSVVDGWVHESLDQLTLLLTSDAGPIEQRGRGRSALVEGWRQRMHAHEYGRLSGLELVDPRRIERYRYGELPPASSVASSEVRPGEVLVRVPLEVTRIAGERFFGDTMLLVLRREGREYRVAAYGEVE